MQEQILLSIPVNEFRLIIADVVNDCLNLHPTTLTPPAQEPDQLLTRKETAARLNITLATLHEYTKAGRIRAHRIGSRVLYKESDILAALRQVKTNSFNSITKK